MHLLAGDPGRGDRGRRRCRAATAGSSSAWSSGSASSRARSAGWPSATVPQPSVDGGERLARGDRLLGVPRLAVVAGAVDGGRHRQPRVEPGHGRVGAHREPDTVVEHPAQREGPGHRPGQSRSLTSRSSSRWAGCTLAVTPSTAIRLHVLAARPAGRARSSPARRSPRRRRARPHRAGRRSRARRRRGRGRSPGAAGRAAPRASGWAGRAGSRAATGPAYGSQHQAVLVLREPSLMIFSGPIRARSSQPGSGSPVRSPGRDHAVQPVGVASPCRIRSRPAPPTQRSAHSSWPPLNSKSVTPDDAERGRLLHGAAVGLRAGAVVAEHGGQPAVRRNHSASATTPSRSGIASIISAVGVEPGVVAVAGDQDDRLIGLDRVQQGDDRLLGPRGRSVAPADDREVRPLREPLAHQRDRGRGGRHAAEVEPGAGEVPLGRGGRAGPTGRGSASGPRHRPPAGPGRRRPARPP